MSRVRTIALHEYFTNVRRKEFIMITFGLPLLVLAVSAVSALGTGAVIGSLLQQKRERVGIMDRSGKLKLPPEAGDIAEANIVPVQDEKSAQEEVKSGRLTAFIVVDRDYVQNGRVTI